MSLYIALKPDFLLAVAQGVDSALGAMDVIMRLRGYPMASPSTLQELQDIAENAPDAEDRRLAAMTIRELPTWGVLTPPIECVDHGIAGIVAQRMVDNGLCQDFQSATLLVEAATLKCRLVLTYRADVCGIDSQALTLALVEAALHDCIAVNPSLFVDFFNRPPVVTALAASAGAV
jgi:hypothetical protein